MTGPIAQVFIKIEDYRDVADILSLTKEKVKRAKSVLAKINEIKQQEDAEIDAWNRELEEVDLNVDTLTKTMQKK